VKVPGGSITWKKPWGPPEPTVVGEESAEPVTLSSRLAAVTREGPRSPTNVVCP
jgi:hypothetical protein